MLAVTVLVGGSWPLSRPTRAPPASCPDPGVVLLLVSLLGQRVQLDSFGLLGTQLKVREVVAQRVRISQPAVPDADAAERLRRQAARRQAATLETLDRLLDLYTYVQRTNQ